VLGALGCRPTAGDVNLRGLDPNALPKLTVSPFLRITNESAAVNTNFSFCFVKPESVGFTIFAEVVESWAAPGAAEKAARVVPSMALESEVPPSLRHINAEMDLIHRGISIATRFVWDPSQHMDKTLKDQAVGRRPIAIIHGAVSEIWHSQIALRHANATSKRLVSRSRANGATMRATAHRPADAVVRAIGRVLRLAQPG
jgi:hypothetical protein